MATISKKAIDSALRKFITLAMYRQMCTVLKQSLGYSIDESSAVAAKVIGKTFDHQAFVHVHLALQRLGYLRELGHCKSYAKNQVSVESVTYCWVASPANQNYHTDLLIVLGINQELVSLMHQDSLALA